MIAIFSTTPRVRHDSRNANVHDVIRRIIGTSGGKSSLNTSPHTVRVTADRTDETSETSCSAAGTPNQGNAARSGEEREDKVTSGYVRVIVIDDELYRLLFDDGLIADERLSDLPPGLEPLKVGDEIPWSLTPNGNLRIHYGRKRSA